MKLVSSLSGSVKLCGLGLNPGRRSISGGKTGRRTWFEQEETAASKRSSASATMAEASLVWGGRYPILIVLGMKRSTRSQSAALAKPHHAGSAYMRRFRVVDLATS